MRRFDRVLLDLHVRMTVAAHGRLGRDAAAGMLRVTAHAVLRSNGLAGIGEARLVEAIDGMSILVVLMTGEAVDIPDGLLHEVGADLTQSEQVTYVRLH